ncbi:MAG: glutathione S-transferase [Pseudomonadales bacterium]|nr:glutathione S-transferase [Pseudomonadales bacterium]
MTRDDDLIIRGAPGSPYTRKMLSVLRYRRIGYRFALPGATITQDLPRPKVELLPTIWFPGDDEAVVDSTPIIRLLEDRYPGRSVIPDDPGVAFLDYLLEDYADEWLTKAMFHYRWWYAADIERAGQILPRWRDLTANEKELAAQSEYIRSRQIGRLYVVGSNEVTAPVIEASYQRFLRLFSEHMNHSPYCFGWRPAASDFGLFGQLTQLAMFDPTPMAETFRIAPRVHAWCGVVDDLSGLEPAPGDWLTRDVVAHQLRGLLEEVGRVYVPVLMANAEAVDAGNAGFSTTVDGARWEQRTFPYQAKCLQWLRQEHARLDGEDREYVDAALAGTGCEAMFRHGNG